MNAHNQELLKQFDECYDDFLKVRDSITEKIENLLKSKGIMYISVNSRVKNRSSLAGKLERKGEKYHSISDITDLLGIRIIHYYSKDSSYISNLLSNNFYVDWNNSQDKGKLLDMNKIGYLSVHLICSIKDDGSEAAKRLYEAGLKFEIQVRTILQHMWAESEHDIFYKSNIEIPLKYKRPLNLLSGLLEMADDQFSNLINEIEDYRNRVQNLVKNRKFNELELNGDTFRNYLKLKPFEELTQRIAKLNNMDIIEVDLNKYLKNFIDMGFKTIAEIEDFRLKYSEAAFNLAYNLFSENPIDIVTSSSAINFLFKAKQNAEAISSQ